MLPPALGKCDLGQWPFRDAPRNSRQDESSTARSAHDAASTRNSWPRWEAAGKPSEGWTWPAPTASEHVEPSTLKKQHAKAIKASKVRPFVLYTLRHTFLTRLGESGCDVWTLARIAGHSSIAMSSRYVHPSQDRVLAAMSMLGGHNIGHTDENSTRKDVAQIAANGVIPAV